MHLMNTNVPVLVAMSLSGMDAWIPIRGVYDRVHQFTSAPWYRQLHTWNKHPTPSAATIGNTSFSALSTCEKFKAQRDVEKIYLLEVSLSIIIKPKPSVIMAQPNHMTGLYLPSIVVILPAKMDTTEEPTVNGMTLNMKRELCHHAWQKSSPTELRHQWPRNLALGKTVEGRTKLRRMQLHV